MAGIVVHGGEDEARRYRVPEWGLPRCRPEDETNSMYVSLVFVCLSTVCSGV